MIAGGGSCRVGGANGRAGGEYASASCAGQPAERETEGMVRALGQRGLGARWPLRAGSGSKVGHVN